MGRKLISVGVAKITVKVLTFQQFEPKTGDRIQALEIIGLKENVLMAEYVYHFLLYQVDFLLNATLAKGVKLARSERTSYRLGALDGFGKKLMRAEHAPSEPIHSEPQSAALTVVGQALIKFREDLMLDDYLSGIYPRLGTWRRSSVQVDCDAFLAGHAAGKSLTLNKPLTTHMGNRGRQLGQR